MTQPNDRQLSNEELSDVAAGLFRRTFFKPRTSRKTLLQPKRLDKVAKNQLWADMMNWSLSRSFISSISATAVALFCLEQQR